MILRKSVGGIIMKQLMIFTLILILLLTACSNESSIPKEQKHRKKMEENIFVTEDGKIRFSIYNTAKLPEKKVESIKLEILSGYNNIINHSIKTDYVPSNKINIFLLKGNEMSWGLRNELKLYYPTSWYDKIPIVHELTHTLLGHGNNFETSKGYLTQEGFADYMENRYGKQKLPVHKVMKYLINSHKNIPLYKLIDENSDDSLFRPQLINLEEFTIQWISYIHANSFVTFLIDTYGISKFQKIYNQDNLGSKLEEVYGENTDELEKEWLHFIQQTQLELTSEDKMKINNFYYINSALDSIDPNIFIRK